MDLKADWVAAKLAVNDDNSAVITFEDGNCNILRIKYIPFTDFPAQTAEIWVIDGVAILPSEY